jgi:hydrogenase nickel incorporation protein HypB
MCDDCGCGLPGENPARISSGHTHRHEHGHEHVHTNGLKHSHPHTHEHAHGHSHDHGQDHDHDHHEHSHGHPHSHSHDQGHDPEHSHVHTHEPAAADARRTLEIRQAILAKNDRLAERNRGFFAGRCLLAINVLSSPGSGKTTLLRETIRALGPQVSCGVIVGDLATDNDAQRLREAGAPVVQISTGTMCHLEAEMVARALDELALQGPGLLIIENVGNLVCPASYDLGEDLRIVLLSVTEGEDKPLKYPPVFESADVVVISKMDLAAACEFNREKALANVRRMAPRAVIFELSARTGAGMSEWCGLLKERFRQKSGTVR